MKIREHIVAPDAPAVVIAAGCFDGVHLGHQAVIGEAVRQARVLGGEAWVLTFDPHPAKVLVPHKAPPLLYSRAQQIAALKSIGTDGVFLHPFTTEFASQTADAFVRRLCAALPNLRGITVGQDWSFGSGAEGKVDALRDHASEFGVSVTALEPVMHGDSRISSTRIRAAVHSGDFREAAAMLGRPFSVLGHVVHGRKVGRNLGFPTANLRSESEVLPDPGIYAARVQCAGKEYKAAAYIGARRTFADTDGLHVLEVFLLDFEGDLYGQELEVEFADKIRDDRKFESLDALVRQIRLDLEQTRRLL